MYLSPAREQGIYDVPPPQGVSADAFLFGLSYILAVAYIGSDTVLQLYLFGSFYQQTLSLKLYIAIGIVDQQNP